MAGDKTGLVAGQEDGGVGHVHHGPASPFYEAALLPDGAGDFLGRHVVPPEHPPVVHHEHLRRHPVRGDAVDPDPLVAQLARGGPDQAHDGPLRHRVGMAGEAAQQCRGARAADDGASPAALRHRPGRVLDPVNDAVDVHRDHGPCLVHVHAHDTPVRPGDTGVVEDDIQAAFPRQRELHRRLHVGLLRDVTVDVPAADRFRQFGSQPVHYVGNDDVCAMLGEEFRRAGADASRPTSYDRNLTQQP